MMDIYSKPGSKVRATFEGGLDYEHDWSRDRGLVQGEVYTVRYCHVDSSRTDVQLEELPDHEFNSVLFENVEEDR